MIDQEYLPCPKCGEPFDSKQIKIHMIGTPFYSYECRCGLKTAKFDRDRFRDWWNDREENPLTSGSISASVYGERSFLDPLTTGRRVTVGPISTGLFQSVEFGHVPTKPTTPCRNARLNRIRNNRRKRKITGSKQL